MVIAPPKATRTLANIPQPVGIAAPVPTFRAAFLSELSHRESPRGFPQSARISHERCSCRGFPYWVAATGNRHADSHVQRGLPNRAAATGNRHADSHGRRGFLTNAAAAATFLIGLSPLEIATRIPTVSADFSRTLQLPRLSLLGCRHRKSPRGFSRSLTSRERSVP